MEIINFFNCKDHYEARKKEQEYFILLNATLNSIEPLPKPKNIIPNITTKEKNSFFCQTCNIHCTSSKKLEDHMLTHTNLIGCLHPETLPVLKSSGKFSCKICDYNTSRRSQYDRHNSTAKHLLETKKHSAAVLVPPQLRCNNCDKIYKNRSGLWKHNKVCMQQEDNKIQKTSVKDFDEVSSQHNKDLIINLLLKETMDFKNIILDVVKSNSDIQKQMLDMCKNNSTNITNNNNIHSNSHNKTFNLQFFLNEQCKDAMNISDFANSFDLQLSDLESVGELGYVEGITKIFLDKLNSMDIYKRPIHCSDAKRETLYVKDDNKWEKEAKNNPKLRYAIKTISFRNMKLASLWSDTYPESINSDSYLSDTYIKIIKESTGGNGEISISEDKIIRMIAKEILIDKT